MNRLVFVMLTNSTSNCYIKLNNNEIWQNNNEIWQNNANLDEHLTLQI